MWGKEVWGKEVSVGDAVWGTDLALPARLVRPEDRVVAVGSWPQGTPDE